MSRGVLPSTRMAIPSALLGVSGVGFSFGDVPVISHGNGVESLDKEDDWKNENFMMGLCSMGNRACVYVSMCVRMHVLKVIEGWDRAVGLEGLTV